MADNTNRLFLPIRIGTLRPGDVVNFDIFILVAEKYVHYIRTSDPFDPDRIDRLRNKGVKKLYIPEESEGAYLAYLDRGLNSLKNTSVSINERSQIVSNAMTNEAENALHNVETERGYRSTEDRIQKVVDFLLSETSALKSVLGATGCAQDVYQHAANATTLTLSLASKLGVQQPKELLDLGIASLLHDAGLTELGFNAETQYEKLSVADLKKYQEHPIIISQKLNGKPYINKNVLELIANHEEKGDGLGYPGKKRISTLPLTSQILNLCDAYDHFSVIHKLPPVEAIKQFFGIKIGLYNLDHIKALGLLLK